MRSPILSFRWRSARFTRSRWVLWLATLSAAPAYFWHEPARRPQGEAPPVAPSIAVWNALPPDAPFTYQVTEILPFNANFPANRIFATDINNAAQVVGFCGEEPTTAAYGWRKIIHLAAIAPHLPPRPTSGTRAFYWSRGRTDILSALGRSRAAEAFFINDKGQIAGNSQPDSPDLFQNRSHHAVLWDDFRAAPRDVGASLAPATSVAFGLNAQGNVGVWEEAKYNPSSVGYESRAHLWSHGILQSMAKNAPLALIAFGLNNRDEALGAVSSVSSTPGESNFVPVRLRVDKPPAILSELQKSDKSYWLPYRHNDAGDMTGSENGIFLYQNHQIKNLWPPKSDALYDTRYVLNQNGDVAGYHEAINAHDPFLLRKNQMVKLNERLGPSPRWKIVSVDAMNDRGQIVARGNPMVRGTDGSFTEKPGVGHILLLTPVLP